MFDNKSKPRRKRNRQTKKILVFDDKSRVDYLTGFKKRKDERRLKGREQMEKMLKEEKKKMQQKRRDLLERRTKRQYLPPDLEEIAKQMEVVEELPEHTVTITDISEVDLAGQGGLHLGQNKFQPVEEKEDNNENKDDNIEEEEEEEEPKKELPLKKKNKILRDMNTKLQMFTAKHNKILGIKTGKKHKKNGKKPRRMLSKKRKHRKKKQI